MNDYHMMEELRIWGYTIGSMSPCMRSCAQNQNHECILIVIGGASLIRLANQLGHFISPGLVRFHHFLPARKGAWTYIHTWIMPPDRAVSDGSMASHGYAGGYILALGVLRFWYTSCYRRHYMQQRVTAPSAGPPRPLSSLPPGGGPFSWTVFLGLSVVPSTAKGPDRPRYCRTLESRCRVTGEINERRFQR